MNIPPQIGKCVCFIGYKDHETFKPVGTAFFAIYPLGEGRVTQYLVTARHVVEVIQNRTRDGKAQIRLNLTNGLTGVREVPLNGWLFNDDDRIDVAITHIGVNPNWDHMPIGLDMYATKSILSAESIGPGNRLYFPGLFSRHAGEERNLPIIRTGNIAAMPGERIRTKWGRIHAFLAEVRSIGGLSGSPVFVQLGPDRVENQMMVMGPMKTYFLGLVHGHFDVSDQRDASSEDSFWSPEARSVNMGIGMIVPAYDVLSTLEHPDCIERHRQLEANWQAVISTETTIMVAPQIPPQANECDAITVVPPVYPEESSEQPLENVSLSSPRSGGRV